MWIEIIEIFIHIQIWFLRKIERSCKGGEDAYVQWVLRSDCGSHCITITSEVHEGIPVQCDNAKSVPVEVRGWSCEIRILVGVAEKNSVNTIVIACVDTGWMKVVFNSLMLGKAKLLFSVNFVNMVTDVVLLNGF